MRWVQANPPPFFLKRHLEGPGGVAEWTGRGLQNLVRWFESSRRLQKNRILPTTRSQAVKIALLGEQSTARDAGRPAGKS